MYNFIYKAKNSYKIMLLFVALVNYCAPPANWKGSQYLAGAQIRQRKATVSLVRGKASKVKVKIHYGVAQRIYTANRSQTEFYFKDRKGKVEKGSGSYLPYASGVFKPRRNYFKLNKKIYKGFLSIKKQGNKYLYVNIVSLDEYLMSVVGHEMSPNWPIEALKAQAIVARTYLINKVKQRKNNFYQVDATTNDQVYKGINKTGRAKLKKAVIGTKGIIVTFFGKPANVFFHASSGGVTARSSEVWGTDLPYLKNVKVPFSKGKHAKNWYISFSKSKLSQLLHLPLIKKLRISKRSSSGRVKQLIAYTTKGKKYISGSNFRRKLGAIKVKSTLFAIRQKGKRVKISGRGYGHGVGLDQWATKYMAEKHYSYQKIIRLFFPGTSISSS